jgi:MFS family permease
MERSLWAVLVGTFTLRFSTGLTGTLLVFYLADIPGVDAVAVGLMAATFYATELVLSTPFGLVSDRLGHHRVMQLGPAFGIVAVIVTFFTADLLVLGGTRVLEGGSTAASVPSILGFIAMVTAGDELLRGRASARFEGATIAGLGAGVVAAGPLYDLIGRPAFLLNALVYGLSFLIYRFGVAEPPEAEAARRAPHPGYGRYVAILRSSHIWLLAPTWIAINAALGLYTSQTLFQLVKDPDPRFANQLLVGGTGNTAVSLGFGVALLVFFAGLAFWGERFKRYRRTSIIFFGICGGFALVAGAAIYNHSRDLGGAVQLGAGGVLIVGLFVLSGATPAALGLLADVTEHFPADRGAIMGLYSVFLAVGQILGSLIGGVAAENAGIDGVLVATVVLLGVAVVPLVRLRAFEHVVPGGAEGQVELA